MFLIQAALVVAGVLLLSFFDPLNIFNSRKLTMKDTPTVLEQFRQIGELVTAEYYGEVLASAVEIENEDRKNLRTTTKTQLVNFEKEFVAAIKEMEDIKRNGKFYRKFKEKNPDLINTDLYILLAAYFKKNQNLSEEDMVQAYKGASTASLLNSTILDNFLKEKYPDEEINRKVRKSNLVLLGRGYVKAGIDLSNIGEHSLRYIESKKIIQLTMHQPEVLRKSINPWFIPQKKIPGFEFLYVGSKVDVGPKAIATSIKVKQECLDKLVEDAMKADILGQAKTNAEQSLSNLFSLLLDERVTVQIFSHPLVAYSEEIRQEVQQQLSVKSSIPLPVRRLPYTLADSLVNLYSESHLFETLVFLDSTYRWFAPADPKKTFRDKSIDSVYLSLEVKGLYHDFQKDGLLTRLEKETFERKMVTDTVNRRDSLYWIFSNLDQKNKGVKFENFVMDTTTVKGLSVNLASKGMLPSAIRIDLTPIKRKLWGAYLEKLKSSTKEVTEAVVTPASTPSAAGKETSAAKTKKAGVQ
ncbi:hypothetical protein KK083_07885 [Fulvivirgaceae bacterium PWU4]|uniref:Uncharacterized protein n=1 Tax=Chryseosolibacter histidini TaxID=2782349 RepID=A0AAP2GMC2_9BACT|nr:DUF4230 domain-containing protein [Chryseosolibacter histidini]MBT1696788.1 hypothetical protein [Chryseosolibacter histidini]